MYLSDKTIEQRLKRTLQRYGFRLHKSRKVSKPGYCYWFEDGNGEFYTLNRVIDIADRLKEKNL